MRIQNLQQSQIVFATSLQVSNMRRFIFLLILWVLFRSVCGDKVFITLKENESFDEFYTNDMKYPEELRVRDHITNTFSIGKFKGFVGDFSNKLLDRLKKCPYISEITPDIKVHALDTTVQSQPPRHLARVSQRKKLHKRYSFIYDDNACGKNVNAYILDSGVEVGHPEFEGRARSGKDFTSQGPGDQNGHGTHVAGLIGSRSYGVAKKVNIIEVKSLTADGSGSLSTIIAALEFASNHRLKSKAIGGVANLSLGAAKNSILNKAIEAAVTEGLVVVVAAGNSNINACKTSPGSAPKAITVGSIDDKTDALAVFSNWGECVDMLAPGVFISSVDFQRVDKPKVLSGTSMSAPIITGIAANLLSAGVDPRDIKRTIVSVATEGKVKRTSMILRGKTPNRIAYLPVYIEHSDSDNESDSDDSDYDSEND